jgi:hypothetical protein
VKYICMEDIENLAAQGKKELILDENTVLMDLARDMAQQLGISVVVRPSASPAKAAPRVTPSSPAKTTPLVASPSPDASPAAGAKPKGCQHAPLAVPARQARSNGHQNSDGVVNQLVELIRKSTGNHTGT